MQMRKSRTRRNVLGQYICRRKQEKEVTPDTVWIVSGPGCPSFRNVTLSHPLVRKEFFSRLERLDTIATKVEQGPLSARPTCLAVHHHSCEQGLSFNLASQVRPGISLIHLDGKTLARVGSMKQVLWSALVPPFLDACLIHKATFCRPQSD